MRAVILRAGELVLEDVPEPSPGPGEVLVAVQACGICGSDLHFVHHGAEFIARSAEMNGVPHRSPVDLGRDVRMGHEFSALVVDAAPGTDAPPPGTLVTSVPALVRGGERHSLSFTNEFAAGYGERMVLSAELLVPLPPGVDPVMAAMSEPLAVGWHAVAQSGVGPEHGVLVIGCGPVGLAIIACLARLGLGPIVAADFSPARRATAVAMGAHEVVDPRVESGLDAWGRLDGRRPLVVFEAVGVPGMIQTLLRDVPRRTRIVVAGLCMEADTIQPVHGILKEAIVQFVVAYDGDEFTAAARAIADGTVDVSPMVTGRVGLDGVADAFVGLATPDAHTKIVVDPTR